MSKKDKLAKDDSERMAAFIEKQVQRERERKGTEAEDDLQKYTELKRSDDEKIKLGLKLNTISTSNNPSSSSTSMPKNVFKSIKTSSDTNKESKDDVKKRKATSALEEIMMEEKAKEKEKKRDKESKTKKQETAWLMKDIMVKIVAKSLGEKYYKQKGHVKEIVDDYCCIVVTNSGAKIKLDQNHLETVVSLLLNSM